MIAPSPAVNSDAYGRLSEGLGIGDTFFYYVTAVDSSGNESGPGAEIQAWTTLAQVPGWPQSAGGNVFQTQLPLAETVSRPHRL